MERQSHMSTVADRAGFVAVYPDGTGGVSDRKQGRSKYGAKRGS